MIHVLRHFNDKNTTLIRNQLEPSAAFFLSESNGNYSFPSKRDELTQSAKSHTISSRFYCVYRNLSPNPVYFPDLQKSSIRKKKQKQKSTNEPAKKLR